MMEFKIIELKNGFKVVYHYHPYSTIVHAGVNILCGTRDEHADEEGMAHFIEHGIFKGTKNKKALDIISALDAVGGELNAYTTKEETCLYSSFQKVYFERALELMSDVLFHSVFPKKEMEKEKTVIIDEIKSYQDSPSERVFDEFEELLFKGHTFGHNILGTENSVKSFTGRMMQDFVKRNYHPSRMNLSVSGNISEKEVVKLAEKYFGFQLPLQEKIHRVSPGNSKVFSKKKKYETYQDHVLIGGRAYAAEDKKRASLVLTNNVLGGNAMNSRLNIALREKHGYAYNVEASYLAYSDAGLYTIYFGTDHKNAAKCEELVLTELKKLRTKKFSTTELEAAKKQLKGQIALSEENRLNRTLGLGKGLLLYGKIHSLKEVYSRIDKVTASGILDVANDVYAPEKLCRLSFVS